jgi:hypothetical protein
LQRTASRRHLGRVRFAPEADIRCLDMSVQCPQADKERLEHCYDPRMFAGRHNTANRRSLLRSQGRSGRDYTFCTA